MKFKIVFTSGTTLEFEASSDQLIINYFAFLRGQFSEAQQYQGPNGTRLVLDFKQVSALIATKP